MLRVEEKAVKVVEYEEIGNVIKEGLENNFKQVKVQILEGTENEVDFREEPWNLSAPGLHSAHPSLAQVGSGLNLRRPEGRSLSFSLLDITKAIREKKEMKDDEKSFIYHMGAGAVASSFLGFNAELIPNVNLETNEIRSKSVHFISEENKYEQREYLSPLLGPFCNLFISSGLTSHFAIFINIIKKRKGKVIKIEVKERTGEKDFIHCIRKAIDDYYKPKYPSSMVALGGVFQLISGKANSHVMSPLFPPGVLEDEVIEKDWLKYFTVSAPLICQSTILSQDLGDEEIVIEHTHFKSEHGDGGHFYSDVTPEIAHYLGYFVICSSFFLISRE